MAEGSAFGITLILAAGFLQGSFMLPMKYTKGWNWENTWLGFSVTAYLILPWLVALLTVPHLRDILAHTSGATIVRTLLWGLGWGLGGLLFGLGVDYVGLALGFAIVIGLTAAIGTIIPLLLLSHIELTSSRGVLVLAGVAVTLVGISVCSWAGKLRENASAKDRAADSSPRRSYSIGLLLCIISGVLCPCGNMGFAFGSEMTAIAIEWGTPARYMSNLLWALLTLPPFICSGIYCVYLLRRKQSLTNFLSQGTWRNYLWAASMGAMWLAGMLLYGMGASKLGGVGSSIGWAIVMSLMVVVANLWGLSTGEWRGVGPKPLRVMTVGLTVLVVAMFLVGSGIR